MCGVSSENTKEYILVLNILKTVTAVRDYKVNYFLLQRLQTICWDNQKWISTPDHLKVFKRNTCS